jgi:DNA polymerase I-like protein with 3'-5' exonuclease and polymerase domains
MNYPMQGTAADIQGATTAALLKVLLTKADRIKMINEVHDSKWFYIREDVLEPCLKWLKDIIEDVPKIFLERFGVKVPFKFPVEIEVGDNFGEMEKMKI